MVSVCVGCAICFLPTVSFEKSGHRLLVDRNHDRKYSGFYRAASALETLTLTSCCNLSALPSTLGRLKALRRLRIVCCESLLALRMGTLRHLDTQIYRLWKMLKGLVAETFQFCEGSTGSIPVSGICIYILSDTHYESEGNNFRNDNANFSLSIIPTKFRFSSQRNFQDYLDRARS